MHIFAPCFEFSIGYLNLRESSTPNYIMMTTGNQKFCLQKRSIVNAKHLHLQFQSVRNIYSCRGPVIPGIFFMYHPTRNIST